MVILVISGTVAFLQTQGGALIMGGALNRQITVCTAKINSIPILVEQQITLGFGYILQANQQKETLQAALALRQQYYTSKGELETCLKDCNDQLEAVNVIGVAVPTKLDRYKVGNVHHLLYACT